MGTLLASPLPSFGAPLDTDAFIRVAEKVGPSVVSIMVRHEGGDPLSKTPKRDSFGSGFLIDQKGTILTNRHVVEGAGHIRITLADGREFDGQKQASHPTTDVALITLKDPPGDLIPAILGDSRQLRVGQWVAAIGTPFGLRNTLTKGIVSALDRLPENFFSAETIPPHSFIQTDASINPGNSGGPLANLNSEVIGLNVLIVSPLGVNIGLGFSIPIDTVKELLPLLLGAPPKTVDVGWIGITTQKLDEELRISLDIPKGLRGLLITQVTKGGPAQNAGIKETDVILNVGDQSFSDPLRLEQFFQRQQEGQGIVIEIWRKRKTLQITVVVAKKPLAER